MAVKLLRRPGGQEDRWRHDVLKREVEILSQISHPHVVSYITSQGWDGPEVEIFMGLKDGTLQSLLESRKPPSITQLAQSLFHQMLQALDFLASKGIVHRDVKPENILYVQTRVPVEPYQFQLGDFGLSNRIAIATTWVGSPIYMAPEILQGGIQTHKVDVWSLFVTMLWPLDIQGFRQKSQGPLLGLIHKAILTPASEVEVIQEMSRLDPNDRASAAQMLVKCFNGVGLTTPRSQVPPIGPAKVETKASTEAPPPARRSFRSGPNQATDEFRVRRRRKPR